MSTHTHSYAERLKMAMAAERGPRAFGHMTIRDLETLSKEQGYPIAYEHIRRIINEGSPHVSREVNGVLCRILRLDEAMMWHVVNAEKLRKKHGIEARILAPRDREAQRMWSYLSPKQHADILNRIRLHYETNKKLASAQLAAVG